MALLNRNSGSEVPASQVEYQQEPGRNWRALVVYLLLALLVAALVVFSGRWVYQQLTSGASDTPPVATESKPQSTEEKGAQGKAGDSSTTLTPAPNSANQTPAPSANNRTPGVAPTPGPSPSNLPKNGPGDVVALFIGISFAAGALHYIITSRRLQNI